MKSELFNKRDVIAYFFVAATGASINLLVGSVSQSWFPITYKEALILGYLIASVFGFFLTKIFAFSTGNATKSRREMLKFAMVTVLSFVISVYGANELYLLSVKWVGEFALEIPFSVKTVQLNKLVCQVTAMGVSFLSNFILHKRFTFADTGILRATEKAILTRKKLVDYLGEPIGMPPVAVSLSLKKPPNSLK
jgi:putative flippase GtrA